MPSFHALAFDAGGVVGAAVGGNVVFDVGGQGVAETPKSHQHRSVPVPRFLLDDLAALVAGRGPEDLVFVTSSGAVLRNLNFRRDVFDRAAVGAGLDGLTPHELRHTAASLR